jgi:hypothetical protein
MTTKIKVKTCCVCGGEAGSWQQWWNRDTGYGVCTRCVVWTEGRNRERGWAEAEVKEETRESYGVQDQHYG